MKKKLNVIFFIDYDKNSGLGHLNRCLHFLKYLKSDKITFVTKKKIFLKGIKNINKTFSSVFENKNIYDLAVIDSYKISTTFEKKLKKKCQKIITIDDLNYRKYVPDILINYNPEIRENVYYKKTRYNTNYLIGPKYNFIIDREEKFYKVKNKTKFNILIYFGTKNRTNFIKEKILKNIYRNKNKIEKIIILSNHKFKYKDLKISFYMTDKRKLIQKKLKASDICFLSTGVIVYEALNYNKLIFGKYISKNQRNNYKYLLKNNKILPLSKIKNLKFTNDFISKVEQKNNLDDSSKKLIFKLIINPIIDRFGNRIHLEYYNKNYSKEIYSLQTKDFRKNYLNTSTFTYKVHLNYLKKVERNINENIFILKNDCNFVGYIKTSEKNNLSEVSIAIKKSFQNKGIATKVLRYLIKNNFFINKPIARINRNNISSIMAFRKAGFKNIKFF